jgi:peroxiredoxin
MMYFCIYAFTEVLFRQDYTIDCTLQAEDIERQLQQMASTQPSTSSSAAAEQADLAMALALAEEEEVDEAVEGRPFRGRR